MSSSLQSSSCALRLLNLAKLSNLRDQKLQAADDAEGADVDVEAEDVTAEVADGHCTAENRCGESESDQAFVRATSENVQSAIDCLRESLPMLRAVAMQMVPEAAARDTDAKQNAEESLAMNMPCIAAATTPGTASIGDGGAATFGTTAIGSDNIGNIVASARNGVSAQGGVMAQDGASARDDAGARDGGSHRGGAQAGAIAAPAADTAVIPKWRGVYASSAKWVAQVHCGGHAMYLGRYTHAEQAAWAYDRAIQVHARRRAQKQNAALLKFSREIVIALEWSAFSSHVQMTR